MAGIDSDHDVIGDRYLRGDYAAKNPTWDSEDAPWKADQVLAILEAHGVRPATVGDIGCGAGKVLAELHAALPSVRLTGFDVAPDTQRFWQQHAAAGIEFRLGDFFSLADAHYDLLLVLDVIEHLRDPFGFLSRLRPYATHYIFHIPLDLSALSVSREMPLLAVRRKVGHIHYFTKGLALSLLEESGYDVIDARYTGAAFSAPQRGWRTRLAALPRRLLYAIDRDLGARVLGGETLMVLARVPARTGNTPQ